MAEDKRRSERSDRTVVVTTYAEPHMPRCVQGGDDDLEDLLSMVQSASPPRKSESRDVSTIGTGGGSSRAATLFNNGSSREISSRSGLATSHGQKR